MYVTVQMYVHRLKEWSETKEKKEFDGVRNTLISCFQYCYISLE